MTFDILVAIAIGAITPLMLLGIYTVLGRGRDAVRWPPDQPPPSSERLIGFRIEPAPQRRQPIVDEPIGTRRPAVTLPASTLAGLPVSRPVVEGRLRKHKPGVIRARRAYIRRTLAAGDCPDCAAERAAGRIYCSGCERRLAPFLR